MLYKIDNYLSNSKLIIPWAAATVLPPHHPIDKEPPKTVKLQSRRSKYWERGNTLRANTEEMGYRKKKSQSIIKLIPMFAPTCSEDTRCSEISVANVNFPELSPRIQCDVKSEKMELEAYEKKVFDYFNVARIRPSFIASILDTRLRESKITFKGNENTGRQRVNEAVAELVVTCPLEPLKHSRELSEISRKVLESVDCEAVEEDPRQVSALYKQTMADNNLAEGEKAKILYLSKSNTPENLIFDLIVNGSNGETQREKMYNPKFKSAGLSIRTENNRTTMLFICYYQ